MNPRKMQKLSTLSQKEKLGEEGYREMMRKKALKGARLKRKMMKDGRLVLLNGKWRRAGKEKKLTEYDKYGKLRTIEESKVINKSLGYCPTCNELVFSDGNAKSVNYKTVAHKVCPLESIKKTVDKSLAK